MLFRSALNTWDISGVFAEVDSSPVNVLIYSLNAGKVVYDPDTT